MFSLISPISLSGWIRNFSSVQLLQDSSTYHWHDFRKLVLHSSIQIERYCRFFRQYIVHTNLPLFSDLQRSCKPDFYLIFSASSPSIRCFGGVFSYHGEAQNHRYQSTNFRSHNHQCLSSITSPITLPCFIGNYFHFGFFQINLRLSSPNESHQTNRIFFATSFV